jgi:hypothetical protein
MTALRLFLAGTCGPTLGIAYSIGHPKTEAAQEVGCRQLRVSKEQTYEALRLGPALKFPPLAAAVSSGDRPDGSGPRQAGRQRGAQTAVARSVDRRSFDSGQYAGAGQNAGVVSVCPSDLAAPPPRPAPTAPASNVMTFYDSG